MSTFGPFNLSCPFQVGVLQLMILPVDINRKPLPYVELSSFPLPTIGEDTVSGLMNASFSSSLSTTI